MRSRIFIVIVAALTAGCTPPAARPSPGTPDQSLLEQRLIGVDTIVAGQRVYREPEVDRPPIPIHRTTGPAYPKELKSKGVEGRVEFRFVVDSTGSVNMSTLEQIAYSEPEFATSVREILPRQKYRPAEHRGRRVPVWTVMVFEFRIER